MHSTQQHPPPQPHEKSAAMLASVLPPEQVLPFTDRLGGPGLLARLDLLAGTAEAVLAHGRPEHLLALAENPNHRRELRPPLIARLQELAPDATPSERRTLAAALSPAYLDRLLPVDHLHAIARGPLGNDLAELLAPDDEINVRLIRPLLATRHPAAALRILGAPPQLVTDEEQARAAEILIDAGRPDLIDAQLAVRVDRAAEIAPRRLVRRLLRQGDPGLPKLRRLSARLDDPSEAVGLLRRHRHHPALPLDAPLPPDLTQHLLTTHHLPGRRRRPLPLTVRETLLSSRDCPPELVRAFLDHRTEPIGRAEVHRVQRIAGLAITGENPLPIEDLIRHTAPMRSLLHLARSRRGWEVYGKRRRPRRGPHRAVRRGPQGPWEASHWAQLAAALRTVLTGADPEHLLAASLAAPEYPGTLPELLAELADGRPDSEPAEPADGQPAEPAAETAELPAGGEHLTPRRPEPPHFDGQRLELLHFLLHHAPAPTARAAIALLDPRTVLRLARQDATGSTALNSTERPVLDAVAATRTDPAVRDRLLAAVLPKGGYRTVVGAELRPLIAHGVPGAAAAAEGLQLDAGTAGFLRVGLQADDPDGASAPPDPQELYRRIFSPTGVPYERLRRPLNPTFLHRIDVLDLYTTGLPELVPGTRIDWPTVMDTYRRGIPLPEENASLLSMRPDLPDELAPLLVASHGISGLGRFAASEHWNQAMTWESLSQPGRDYFPGVAGLLEAGALDWHRLMHELPNAPALLSGILHERTYKGEPSSLTGRVAARIRESLGDPRDNPETWTTAAHLLPTFTGSLEHWLATTHAVAA